MSSSTVRDRASAPHIAVIAGDGIGPEVTASALAVVAAAGIEVTTTDVPVSAGRYLDTGELLTDSDLAAVRASDAILLGAVGDPAVPPGVMEREVLLRLRFELDLGLNIRPVRLLPGFTSPAREATPESVDMVFVRENTEGPYAGTGGRFRRGTESEVALQDSVNTAVGVRRAVEHAFALADRRRRHLTWVHKTNVLTHAGGLWSDIVSATAERYPAVEVEYQHADAACIHLLQRPASYDVIVTDNLFGDLLTDLAGAIGGGVGLMPSANLATVTGSPSLFEPIHGSAPDIAGRGLANPVGAILSAALMLDEIGLADAGERIRTAVLQAAADGSLAQGTAEVEKSVISRL